MKKVKGEKVTLNLSVERYAAWLVSKQLTPAATRSCPGTPLRRGYAAAAPPPPPAEPAAQESTCFSLYLFCLDGQNSK